jgi:gluconolactonase
MAPPSPAREGGMRRFVPASIAVLATAAGALAAEPRAIVDKAAFPEGPAFVDGKLHYVEYAGNALVVWDGKTAARLWGSEGCGPSAVAPFGEDLLVTCYDNGTVVRVSKTGETIATYDKAEDGALFVGPNDFAPDNKGGVYFTTSGPWEPAPIVGKVFHMAADGRIVQVADDLHYANGLAVSADGTRLFVNESEAGRVVSFLIGEGGSLSDRRLFVRVFAADPDSGANAYPDGLKLGPDGNLYIGQYSKGRIVAVDAEGKFVKAIDVPSAAAPNLAFSPDGKAIFVMAVDDTSAPPYPSKVYEVRLD